MRVLRTALHFYGVCSPKVPDPVLTIRKTSDKPKLGPFRKEKVNCEGQQGQTNCEKLAQPRGA